jgi:hypothetical protein
MHEISLSGGEKPNRYTGRMEMQFLTWSLGTTRHQPAQTKYHSSLVLLHHLQQTWRTSAIIHGPTTLHYEQETSYQVRNTGYSKEKAIRYTIRSKFSLKYTAYQDRHYNMCSPAWFSAFCPSHTNITAAKTCIIISNFPTCLHSHFGSIFWTPCTSTNIELLFYLNSTVRHFLSAGLWC